MSYNFYPRTGWSRVLSNGDYTFINNETGTKFDAKGFDHWGFDAAGALGKDGEEVG